MFDDSSQSRVGGLAGTLRGRIIAGSYAPGHRLIEATLAGEFAASRGVVREALRRLAAEGVLDLAPHRGAAVRRIARADLAAIAPVREALEGLAARLGAARGPKARRRLAAAMAEQRAAERADDPVGAFAAANIRFHDLVLALAANPRLNDALRPLTLPLSRLLYARLMTRRARLDALAEHAAVVECLVAGDAPGAERAMRAHVRNACEALARLPDPFLA
jgi:DNA-binding GntR family transcriptional regulator